MPSWPPASNCSRSAATEGNQVLSKSASLPAEPYENPQHPLATPAWKQEVNQRLAAHRTRRGEPQEAAGRSVSEGVRAASGRAAEAAARVAARYAKAPSYSELLAGEARAVVRAAGAAAEAARNAQAAAQAVLAGLESGLESGPSASAFWEPAIQNLQHSEGAAQVVPEAQHTAPARWQDEPPEPLRTEYAAQGTARAGAQPRWEEALPAHSADRDVWTEMRVHPSPEPSQDYRAQDYRREPGRAYRQAREEHYAPGVEEGELFASDPVASATVEPVQHLPANLIEFPRELVATRKARPRLAEGPFYNPAQESPQLNIFEVDPAALAAPVYLNDTASGAIAPPEWASIELDHGPELAYPEHTYPAQAYAHAPEALSGAVEAMPAAMPIDHGLPAEIADRAAHGQHYADPMTATRAETGQKPAQQQPSPRAEAVVAVELLVAPLSDRLLASVVDGALVTLAFMAAAVVVIASTAHPPTGRIALMAAGCGLLFFGLLYQFLFLSYAEEGTPGMRYARIALCTFDDDNPAIEQMRMRIPALLLAALPAALGLFWALVDRDHLGWHDRLTRTYQRKY
jgi:uncharacterized RDD family membrane protein YckC